MRPLAPDPQLACPLNVEGTLFASLVTAISSTVLAQTQPAATPPVAPANPPAAQPAPAQAQPAPAQPAADGAPPADATPPPAQPAPVEAPRAAQGAASAGQAAPAISASPSAGVGVVAAGPEAPFSRQRVISSGDQQFVDRGITNKRFNLDRDIGFDLRSKDFLGLELLRYYAFIGTGEGRNSFQPSDFGMMYIGRVEILPFGMFDDYDEPDFERAGPRLSVGLAYSYVDKAKRDRGVLGDTPADGGTTNMNVFNADAMFKMAGFSFLGEFYARNAKRNPGDLLGTPSDPAEPTSAPIGVTPTRDGVGFLTQAGYLIPRVPFEVAMRYAGVRHRSLAGHDALEDRDQLGGALGYYHAHHRLKIQGDYFRHVEDGEWGDGADVVRVQLQAAY
jgi:hypothetical protein